MLNLWFVFSLTLPLLGEVATTIRVEYGAGTVSTVETEQTP
ncbi:hypothetical protein [Cellulomonas soli]|nr:hypothetical protein [Cellulomonas soli]NYI59279.1 hypothetical protein [Cellulomonas soli]